MPLIKLCVAKTTLQSDTIEEDVLDSWLRTDQGKWVNEYAKSVTTHLETSWADDSFVISIEADMDRETYITFRLMWPHRNV
jgi:hypothetical protein